MLNLKDEDEFLLNNWKTLNEKELNIWTTKVNFMNLTFFYRLDMDFIKKFSEKLDLRYYVLNHILGEDTIFEIMNLMGASDFEKTIQTFRLERRTLVSDEFIKKLDFLLELKK